MGETVTAFVIGKTVNDVSMNYELRNTHSAEKIKWTKKYDKNMY